MTLRVYVIQLGINVTSLSVISMVNIAIQMEVYFIREEVVIKVREPLQCFATHCIALA